MKCQNQFSGKKKLEKKKKKKKKKKKNKTSLSSTELAQRVIKVNQMLLTYIFTIH